MAFSNRFLWVSTTFHQLYILVQAWFYNTFCFTSQSCCITQEICENFTMHVLTPFKIMHLLRNAISKRVSSNHNSQDPFCHKYWDNIWFSNGWCHDEVLKAYYIRISLSLQNKACRAKISAWRSFPKKLFLKNRQAPTSCVM